MRFFKYINEQETDKSGLEREVKGVERQVREFNYLIRTNCKDYLRLISGKSPLYRGSHKKSTKNIGEKKKVRKDRIPQGMDGRIFPVFNTGLEEGGHNKRSESISCSSKIENVFSFGKPYFVFPIGKFSYSGIRTRDLNINSTGGKISLFEDYLYYYAEKKNIDIDYIPSYDEDELETKTYYEGMFNTDKKFDVPYKRGYEIWINCDGYYIFPSGGFGWHEKKQEIYII